MKIIPTQDYLVVEPIKEVTKGHFTLVDGTYIPAHRIIKIKLKEKK